MLLFFHFWENGHKQHFLFGAPKGFASPFFSPLFGERKESPPRQKKRPWNPRRMEFENDMVSFVGADDSVRPAVGKDGFAEVCGEILVR